MKKKHFTRYLPAPARIIGLVMGLTIAVAMGSSLPSCMVGPDFSAPDMAPGLDREWMAAKLDDKQFSSLCRPQIQWWKQFNDPVLTGLITQLSGSSLALARARERIVELSARQGVTGADKRLQLAAALGYTRASAGDDVVSTQGVVAGQTLDVYSTGLTAGWEPDLWGRTARLLEAGEEDIRAGYADLHGMFVSLASELCLAYIEARTLEARIANVKENLAIQNKTLELARSAYDAGNGSKLSVVRAKRLISATTSRLPELSWALDSARNKIKVILSCQPRTCVIPPASFPGVPSLIGMGVPADIITHRPDIIRALHQYHSAVAGIGAAQAQKYPALSITGTLTLSTDTVGGLFDRQALLYTLGPGLRFPIFTGGRIESEVAVRTSKACQARLALEQQIIQALSEVETAGTGVVKTQCRVKALACAQKNAAQSVALSDELYRSGLGDLFEVLDNQQALLAIQESLLTARQQALSQVVALYRALGGGWQVLTQQQ